MNDHTLNFVHQPTINYFILFENAKPAAPIQKKKQCTFGSLHTNFTFGLACIHQWWRCTCKNIIYFCTDSCRPRCSTNVLSNTSMKQLRRQKVYETFYEHASNINFCVLHYNDSGLTTHTFANLYTHQAVYKENGPLMFAIYTKECFRGRGRGGGGGENLGHDEVLSNQLAQDAKGQMSRLVNPSNPTHTMHLFL